MRIVSFYLHNVFEITKLEMKNRFLVTRDQGKKKGQMWNGGNLLYQIMDFACGNRYIKFHT